MGIQFEVRVRTTNGQYHTITIDVNEDIKKLKYEIYRKTNIQARDQRLIYKTKQLEEGNTLNFYKIQQNETIILIRRSIGGI